jgi:beta-barrel assembly-enhancing protease
MNDIYKAIVHGLGKRDGATCDLTVGGSAFQVSLEGEDGFRVASLPYLGMQVGFAGVDDRYVVFEGSVDNRPFKLMVSDKKIISTLEAVGASRPFMDALRHTVTKRDRRSMGRMSIFVGLGLLILLIGVGIWFGFSLGVDKAVSLVPPEWEVALGQSAAGSLLQENKVCSDPALAAVMNEMGARLIGGLDNVPYNFRIRVLDTDDVNAFALPGGYLFLNKGLIEQADDGFEVAGVLAHEIQHAMLRHGIRNIVREAGVMLMLQVLVGDASGIEQFLLYHAASLSSMSFSRDQESAADSHGLDLMYRANMDPTGLPRFLKKLAAKEGSLSNTLSILSTHPASMSRVKELQAMIQRRGSGNIKSLTRDLQSVKGRCDPVTLADPDAPL